MVLVIARIGQVASLTLLARKLNPAMIFAPDRLSPVG
jgi:hypothetical protein